MRLFGRFSRFDDWLYYIQCLLFRRHNVIKLDIPPTWHDKVELIRLAMFKLLVDFVEQEKPFEFIDWEVSKEQKDIKETIERCYSWIKTEREPLVQECEHRLHMWSERKKRLQFEKYGELEDLVNFHNVNDSISDEYYDQHNELEKLIEVRDQEVLHDIVTVRQYLWT